MITAHRSADRRHDRHRTRECWLTFSPDRVEAASARGFGALELFNECRLSPGVGMPRPPRHEAEVVTYVREGTLLFEETSGRSGNIQAGEFQRMTTGEGHHRGEVNAVRAGWAHVFQIWLHPTTPAVAANREQKRFSAAARRGALCLVASPDARGGSLRLSQPAWLYSALLGPGQHVVHALERGRGAWLHLVHGEITAGDLVLTAGDSLELTDEPAVSLTARTHAELLLLELALA